MSQEPSHLVESETAGDVWDCIVEHARESTRDLLHRPGDSHADVARAWATERMIACPTIVRIAESERSDWQEFRRFGNKPPPAVIVCSASVSRRSLESAFWKRVQGDLVEDLCPERLTRGEWLAIAGAWYDELAKVRGATPVTRSTRRRPIGSPCESNLRWFVDTQVNEIRPSLIATRDGVRVDTVNDARANVARSLGLRMRVFPPGRPPKK